METIYHTIAKNTLTFRKDTGFSQLALAASAEITLKTLHTIEHTNTNCRLRTLEKVADALNIPIVRLFEGKQNSSSNLDSLIRLLSQSQ